MAPGPEKEALVNRMVAAGVMSKKDTEGRYRHGVPPMLLKALVANPRIINRIKPEAFGVSKEQLISLIRNYNPYVSTGEFSKGTGDIDVPYGAEYLDSVIADMGSGVKDIKRKKLSENYVTLVALLYL